MHSKVEEASNRCTSNNNCAYLSLLLSPFVKSFPVFNGNLVALVQGNGLLSTELDMAPGEIPLGLSPNSGSLNHSTRRLSLQLNMSSSDIPLWGNQSDVCLLLLCVVNDYCSCTHRLSWTPSFSKAHYYTHTHTLSHTCTHSRFMLLLLLFVITATEFKIIVPIPDAQ